MKCDCKGTDPDKNERRICDVVSDYFKMTYNNENIADKRTIIIIIISIIQLVTDFRPKDFLVQKNDDVNDEGYQLQPFPYGDSSRPVDSYAAKLITIFSLL